MVKKLFLILTAACFSLSVVAQDQNIACYDCTTQTSFYQAAEQHVTALTEQQDTNYKGTVTVFNPLSNESYAWYIKANLESEVSGQTQINAYNVFVDLAVLEDLDSLHNTQLIQHIRNGLSNGFEYPETAYVEVNWQQKSVQQVRKAVQRWYFSSYPIQQWHSEFQDVALVALSAEQVNLSALNQIPFKVMFANGSYTHVNIQLLLEQSEKFFVVNGL